MLRQKFLIILAIVTVLFGGLSYVIESPTVGNSNVLQIFMLISISAIISLLIINKLADDISKKIIPSSKNYVVENSLKISLQKDEYLYTLCELKNEPEITE